MASLAAIVLATILVMDVGLTAHPSRFSLAPPVPSPGPRDPVAGFLENAGQVDPAIRLYAVRPGPSAAFADGRVVLFSGAEGAEGRIELTFPDATDAAPVGRTELPHRTHFFLGDDPSQWRSGVRSYEEVVYPGLYEGIDLVIRQDGSALKYDFLIAPRTDPGIIRLRYGGTDGLSIMEDGSLRIRTKFGDLIDSAPAGLQGDLAVPCGFEPHGIDTVGISCYGYDPTRPLRIDPLLYSTFLGGRFSEGAWAVATDPQGFVYLTGLTDSPDFPVTKETFGFGGDRTSDVFVAKLDPAGRTFVYSIFLGGSARDVGAAIRVDPEGRVHIAGHTRSPDFPTTDGVFDRSHDGTLDVFVAKFSPSGDRLLFSTFLGGSDSEVAGGIAVDGQGNVYVTGRTHSPDFPSPNPPTAAPQQLFEGVQAFVAKIDLAGSYLLYTTLLGGERWDEGMDIVVDASGHAYVAGYTASETFPVTPGAFDGARSGIDDGFAAKIAPDGSIVYATFLGGSQGDIATSIAVDSAGHAYVAGTTESLDFPTTEGAHRRTLNGLSDAFVVRLDPTGSSLVYGTYLGGSGRDEAEGLAVDIHGDAYLAGRTTSPDFPVTPNAFDARLGAGSDGYEEDDGFVARVSQDGGAVVYATYFGGSQSDLTRGLALTSPGEAWVVGFTISVDFPTTSDARDIVFRGGTDAFLAKFRAVAAESSPILGDVTAADGHGHPLEPLSGTTSSPFTFAVRYIDPDGDPPLAGFPVVHIYLDGREISGSPFSMEASEPTPRDVRDGRTYQVKMILPERSPYYTYVFGAYDSQGDAAANWPAPPAAGPQVYVESGPIASAAAIPLEVVLLAVAGVAAAVAFVRLFRRRA